jgi:AcrR family transcriptional regulator
MAVGISKQERRMRSLSATTTTEPATQAERPIQTGRPTQAERSAHTRNALLESAARNLSRYGYGQLVLERVAHEAGYTRGALYHQFKDKQDLTLAVVAWVNETWSEEVGVPVARERDPLTAVLLLARGHAVYCRRDFARVAMALRIEFNDRDHPVGRAVADVLDALVKQTATLINRGRRTGTIPSGPPARTVARALIGAVEGVVIELAGHEPHDERLAAGAALGVLGLVAD